MKTQDQKYSNEQRQWGVGTPPCKPFYKGQTRHTVFSCVTAVTNDNYSTILKNSLAL